MSEGLASPSLDGALAGPAGAPRPPSMFAGLRLLLAAVFGGGAMLALAATWFFANAAADEAYDGLLISAAVQMAESVSVDDGRPIVVLPDAVFETLALARDDRVFYAIRDPHGRLLTGNGDVPPPAGGGLAQLAVADRQFDGVPVRMATIGRYVLTPEAGWVSVVVAQTRSARGDMAWSLILPIGGLSLLVSALGFFAALAAARRVLHPLVRIEQALSMRDDNDVSPLTVSSPRETGALIAAINAVMARLGQRSEKLQSFVGLAAHQVRTPIAALLAQIELLRGDPTTAQREARIDRIHAQLLYLGRLANQLLGHAMITYRAETVPSAPVDLADVARAALRDAVPMSLDRDIAILFRADTDPLFVAGDDVNLREAVTNLVHNAVVHGAPRRLEVVVERHEKDARVTIFDDGPGIPADMRSMICTPFTAARGERPGAGLGLSIVQEIAAAHGGRLVFETPTGGGFAATIVLPAASDL